MTTFGDRLRKAMEVSGIRAIDLANTLCVDRAQISHMLNGQREPSFPVLAKLLWAMPGVDARWLVCGGKDDKP